jgi:hypothetical protein
MTRPLERRERAAVILWLLLGVVVWNGLYDLLLTRGIKDYLLQQALHEAGRGPASMPLALAMDITVRDAVWIATLWASIIVCAGLLTVRVFRTTQAAVQPPSGTT